MNNESELLLANIEQQINKVIFYFMTTGRFPKNWSNDTYNKYLGDRKRVMRIYAVCFHAENPVPDYQHKAKEMIEQQFPHMCAKVYSTMIMCLSFEQPAGRSAELSTGQPMGRSAELSTGQPVGRSAEPSTEQPAGQLMDRAATQTTVPEHLTALVSHVVGGTCSCHCSEDITDLSRLISAYQELRRDVEDIRARTIQRMDSQFLYLCDLENELFDKVVEGDLEGIEAILVSLAKTVEESNCINIHNEDDLFISTKSYFSYLWRRISRVVFERTGKRRTIPRYITIDLEINAAAKLEDVLGVVAELIYELCGELHLTGHGSFHKVVENVKRYIADNSDKDVSLNYVAERVGLSSYYLSKLFKKEEGVNFKDYVIKVRMEKAMSLIREGRLNINEIADAVGYTNANYFSQAFHKYYGVSPKACQTRGMGPLY